MIGKGLLKKVDRALAANLPNTYVSRFTPPSALEHQRLSAYKTASLGEYRLESGFSVQRERYYRNFIKRTWRLIYPELAFLYTIKSLRPLPSDIAGLLDDLLEQPTLNASLETFSAYMNTVAAQHPDLSQPATLADGKRIWQHTTPDNLQQLLKAYHQSARILQARIKRAFGQSVQGMSILEIGTGYGLLPYALAHLGAEKAVGIDMEYAPESWAARATAIAQFQHTERVELHNMDARHTTFPDRFFDCIISNSVLEHIQDLQACFQEMFRLLKPGGVAVHSVDPYFSPMGGHSLVTLDFPWGHVRLSEAEIVQYLREYRPFEAEPATQFYRQGLTHPHVYLSDYHRIALEAGFAIIDWQENRAVNHLPHLTSDVFKQAQHHHPRITVNDLLTSQLILVIQKPK